MKLAGVPASRNAPCPCGSGRRYKDCHGRVATVGAANAIALLDDARAARDAGRYAQAIASCNRALELAPAHAESWHLRGSIWWQLQDYTAAQRDAERARELGHPDAESLLSAVREGVGLAAQEDALDREVLPRYRPLVVDPPRPALDGVGADRRVLVIDACITGPAIAAALTADARRRGASVEQFEVDPLSTLEGPAARRLATADERDVVVCVGASRPFGDWTLDMCPAATALVLDRVLLTQALDRLREVAGHGRRRVRLVRSRLAPVVPAYFPHVDGDDW